MENRVAYVTVRNTFAGTLQETDDGSSFTYDRDYLASDRATPVSLTLPLQEEPYKSKTLFAFLMG